MSGGVFQELSLDRSLIAAVLEGLKHSRALLSTFCSIICATRFKYFEHGTLLPVICRYCGQIDSYRHLVSCVNIGPHPDGRDQLVEYLVELSKRAYNVNPNLPVPLREGEAGEIEMVDSDAVSEEDLHELWFEDDTELPFDERGLLDHEGQSAATEGAEERACGLLDDEPGVGGAAGSREAAD